MDFLLRIHIYTFAYIYIIIIIIPGPLSTISSRISASGLRSGAQFFVFGSSVTPRGFPLRILPSLSARESLVASSSSIFARLAGLFRDEDGRPSRSQISLCIYLPRSSHALHARSSRAFYPRARNASRLAYAVFAFVPPSPPLTHRRPENLTRARLRHRPPYELRAYVNQYICKLFFCAFFCGATRIFYYYYFFFIFILAYCSVDYRTYTTRSIV